MRRATLPTLLLPLMFLLPGSAALGSDGVVEINRTCAVQTGCFPSDTAGYPVTISGAAGRSYRLTSDLFISGQNTTAIEIAASDITIDLAGFRISCTNFVPPSTIEPCSATGSGTGSGIAADDSLIRSGLEVRDGSVFGTPGIGIDLGDRCVIRNLRVSEAGRDGIQGRDGCVIEGNTAFLNGASGISAAAGATVSGNTVHQNVFGGLVAAQGSTVSNNAAYQNGRDGISAGFGATVSGNSARNNATHGIRVSPSTTVSGNTATGNGFNGINASTGCAVHGNTVGANTRRGLDLGTSSGYSRNVIAGNILGTVIGGVDLGGNLCDGSTTCP